MDHAEARDRLMDLALEPARLRRLQAGEGPGPAELNAHLATCADCRAELETWQATIAALDTAVSTEPVHGVAAAGSLRELAASGGAALLPVGLRARTLAAAHERPDSPALRIVAPRRARRLTVWLAAAAALVVVVAGSAFVIDRTRQLDQARANTAALESVTASLDRILQDPGHRVALLATPAGAPGGSVSWSASENTLVVLTGAIQSPAAGQVYRCFLEQGGVRVAVGEMRFSDSIAYWAGTLDTWGSAPTAGARFLVSLEPIGGGSGGTTVLTGNL